MSLYKLAQFVSELIKTKWPGFYSHDNFPNQFHCTKIEEDNKENKNSMVFINISKRIFDQARYFLYLVKHTMIFIYK